jgi:hypothetical protein
MGWREQLRDLIYLGADPKPTGDQRVDRGPDYWAKYDGTMQLKVVGESHYQDALMRVSGAPPSGDHGFECFAELIPEPENAHDKFAVRVEVQGEPVGYLPRGSAKRFHKRVVACRKRGEPTTCMAYIGRGPDHPYLGINLRVAEDGPLFR